MEEMDQILRGDLARHAHQDDTESYTSEIGRPRREVLLDISTPPRDYRPCKIGVWLDFASHVQTIRLSAVEESMRDILGGFLSVVTDRDIG